MIKASLIYDGRGYPNIPEEMGKPKAGQMEGMPAEQLTELAGRVCYDSLGKGRDSKEYHEHILKVGHLSVCEHFHFTVQADVELGRQEFGRIKHEPLLYLYQATANRPGTYIVPYGHNGVRLTVNLRTVLDWTKYTENFLQPDTNGERASKALGDGLENIAAQLAPAIVKPKRPITSSSANIGFGIKMPMQSVEPVDEHEKWISLFLSGSRGMSHEQVRHGDWTAISQRSTRFVDETDSPWVVHPLLEAYLIQSNNEALKRRQLDLIEQSRSVYRETVDVLEKWATEKGVEKIGARKQARGAARGYLGNGLVTELVFSASVYQWKHMLRQRCSAPAEAEIRQMYCDVLQALKRTGYHDSFKDLVIVDSPDGIGRCLKEN